ncbi:hypothetical protein V6N13_066258 [Hibiscus sabdariffa]
MSTENVGVLQVHDKQSDVGYEPRHVASSKADAYSSSPARAVWTPPLCGFLKFNVDGACSKEGLCGVGGVLRDPQGSILLEFSQSIGVGSVLLAEILAIKIVVERFVNSPWVKRWRLIVESDSKSAVEWISTPSVANPLFRQLVGSIYTFFFGWSLVYRAYSKRTECDNRFTGQGGYWLRDKSGVRIMGYSRFIGVCSTFDEKLLGVLDGLDKLWCLGYHIVVIELDSLAAVCILKGSANAADGITKLDTSRHIGGCVFHSPPVNLWSLLQHDRLQMQLSSG